MNLSKRLKMACRVVGSKSFGEEFFNISSLFATSKLRTTKGNYSEYIQNFESWVYAAVSCIARNTAKVPLKLYVDKSTSGNEERKEIYEHPFLDLWKRVNPWMDNYFLRELTRTYLELIGNAYWYLPSNRLNLPGEIWPLLAHRVKVVSGKQVLIDRYEYNLGDRIVVLSPDEVIHFKFPNPESLVVGVGPLQAILSSVDTNKAMQEYSLNLFENGAFFGTTINVPEDMSPDNYNRLKTELKEQYTGVGNAGKTKILRGAEVKRAVQTMAELAFIDGRKLAKEDILGIYGVPAHKLGAGESGAAASRSTAYELDRVFTDETISPRLEREAAIINQFVLPRWDEKLVCEFEDISPADKEFNLKLEESRLNSGVWTINQVKEQEGEEPVEYGDKPILPMNRVPIYTGGVLNEPVEPEKSVSEKDVESPQVKSADERINWERFQEIKHRQWPVWVIKEERFERKMIGPLRRLWQEQSKVVLGNLRRYFGTDDIDMLFPAVTDEAERFEKETEGIVREVFASGIRDGIQDTEEVHDLIGELEFSAQFPGVKEKIAEIKRVEIDWDVVDPYWQEYFENYKFELLRIQETSKADLSKILRKSLDEGWSIGTTQEAIQAKFDQFEAARSLRIARTETVRALNSGQLAHYRSINVREKVWATALDMEVCDDCEPLEGEVAGVDESFSDTDNFSGVEVPGLHPNCRCRILALDLIREVEN